MKGKLEAIKEMAEFGRSGSSKKLELPFGEMKEFLNYVIDARGKGLISVADDFFCYVAALKDGGPVWRSNPHFVKELCRSAAYIAALIELGHSAIGARDPDLFEKRTKEIGWFLELQGFKDEKLRAQKELALRIQEQKRTQAVIDSLERHKQEYRSRLQEFIDTHSRSPRKAHCFNCYRDLDEVIDSVCGTCGWIKCRCGACGCKG
jgi:hypothetical protein